MDISELSIHKMDKSAPKVEVVQYSNFSTIEINADGGPRVKFFLYSQQQVVNFKNNFLQAVERPTKVG